MSGTIAMEWSSTTTLDWFLGSLLHLYTCRQPFPSKYFCPPPPTGPHTTRHPWCLYFLLQKATSKKMKLVATQDPIETELDFWFIFFPRICTLEVMCCNLQKFLEVENCFPNPEKLPSSALRDHLVHNCWWCSWPFRTFLTTYTVVWMVQGSACGAVSSMLWIPNSFEESVSDFCLSLHSKRYLNFASLQAILYWWSCLVLRVDRL